MLEETAIHRHFSFPYAYDQRICFYMGHELRTPMHNGPLVGNDGERLNVGAISAGNQFCGLRVKINLPGMQENRFIILKFHFRVLVQPNRSAVAPRKRHACTLPGNDCLSGVHGCQIFCSLQHRSLAQQVNRAETLLYRGNRHNVDGGHAKQAKGRKDNKQNRCCNGEISNTSSRATAGADL